MQSKPKPCKGTGKAKGHGCGAMVLKRTYGLGYECGCYPKWLYSTPEGLAKVERHTLKATKPRRELEKAEKKEKELIKLETLKKNVRKVCHQYIRKRDEGKPCVSCGAKWNKNFQAGHFYKAELYSSLKYDEHNINGQCRVCNLHKDGEFRGYGIGLKMRIGSLKFFELNQKATKSKQTDFKWDRQELEEIRKYYQQKLKEIE